MVFLHVAINVTDLQRAAAFYEGLLGLTPVDRPLKFPGRWYQIGTVQIHLIQAEKVVDPCQDQRWGRNPHFALGVTDLASLEQRLMAAQIPLQRSASGRAAIFVADPDGNLIELSQVS
ncbi:VOC family protein [Thermosynechococcus sichuanensis E542]|uniref:VOC family protein n=1 Tax=Thermosynechococcus sichuanensis E542 TaxID=2016101 RepID=A0A7D6J1J0_9CYAN|nr:VOC family protein [Thermosynechococcus vestitus]QLL29816.1 VOC family protein [Thermosynechococcus vestitus E542]